MPQIERMLDEFVAPGATVVVANEGLLELLRLHEREVLPLPHESRQTEKDMLAALEQSARAGAEVLVVPKISLWWNERFNTLQTSLRRRFAEIASPKCATSTTSGGGLPGSGCGGRIVTSGRESAKTSSHCS